MQASAVFAQGAVPVILLPLFQTLRWLQDGWQAGERSVGFHLPGSLGEMPHHLYPLHPFIIIIIIMTLVIKIMIINTSMIFAIHLIISALAHKAELLWPKVNMVNDHILSLHIQ